MFLGSRLSCFIIFTINCDISPIVYFLKHWSSQPLKKPERPYDFAMFFLLFEHCGNDTWSKSDFGTLGVILRNIHFPPKLHFYSLNGCFVFPFVKDVCVHIFKLPNSFWLVIVDKIWESFNYFLVWSMYFPYLTGISSFFSPFGFNRTFK